MPQDGRTPDPSKPAEALEAAIRANDPARVATVLETYPELKAHLDDPLPTGGFGATALLTALPRANREMIDLLLRAGANINARSHWWAGSFGVLDDDHGLAPFLIERGAIVDAHAAARLGMLDTLKALVAADPAVVHTRGGDGQMPLHFAASVEIAEYLLAHGADIDACDIDHESTAAQWMLRERQEVARYLVSRGCRTDILMAAALGDIERVRRHLDDDPASIRTRVNDESFPRQNPRSGGTIYIWVLGAKKTPHLVAREFGHEDIFVLLMSRSSDELKLAQACEIGDEATFKALLELRPNLVQTLSDDDRRKVADAAEMNNTTAVRLMLTAGWPVDARGDHGGTALHWAAWHGNAEMTREILRHRPRVDLKSIDYDMSPLGWAIYASVHGWHPKAGDYPAVVEALIQAGAQAPPLTSELEASDAVRDVLRRT